MTPDERQLLSGLFDRTRSAGSQPRDRDAEAFINDAVKQQPYAPYLLSQTVLVQEQALRAASAKLEELQAKVSQYESQGNAGQGQGAGEGFLGSIGRSIFGSGSGAPQPNRQAQPQQGYAQPQYAPQQPQYGQPQGGPWGQAPQAPAAGGGGFMRGALGMAAGVAGGALLGNAISGLFHGPGSNPFGIASGMGGMGGGETIVNNYYGDDAGQNQGGFDQASDGGFDPGTDNGGLDNAGDFGGDDGGFGGGGDDGSYNV